MKNIKKIAVLVMALVMCFTVFAVSASADADTAKVNLVASYNDDATQIIVSVVTSEKIGAIKATFVSSVDIVDEKYYAETDVDSSTQKKDNSTKSKTFVLVTNDTSANGGDTNWADFTVDVNGAATYTFALENIEICDVGEKLAGKNNISSFNVEVKADALTSLGAKYRSRKEAVRYAAKLLRNSTDNSMTIEGKTNAKAVYCGYLHGWSDYTEEKGMNATVNSKTGELTVETPDTTTKVIADKAFAIDETMILYTLAVSMEEHADNAEVLAIPYDAKPFVVYKSDDGYDILFGDEISISYQTVKEIANSAVGAK